MPEKTWQQLLKETDQHINEGLKAWTALKNIAEQAGNLAIESVEQAREAEAQRQIAQVHFEAAATLTRQGLDLREYEHKFAGKTRLYDEEKK